ncbi:hypothetical protein LPJ59_005994, partial [Coemansia sp. RSA 2399]
HLSRALLLLAKDAHGRGTPSTLRRAAGRYVTSPAQRTQYARLSYLSAGGESIPADSWFLRVSRRWQEKKERLISVASSFSEVARASQPEAEATAYERLLRTVADRLAPSTSGQAQSGRASAEARHRRWMAWKKPAASGWDFPTLNASFPFTIPSIPVRLFLVANAGTQGGAAVAPGGVIMPAGLGRSARKFHSMSLTRQPGVPFDNDGNNASVLADHAGIVAQMLVQADAEFRALHGLREKALAGAVGHRRADGSGGSAQPRAARSFMFSHAATGIPKFQNRIPLPKKEHELEKSAGAAEANSKETSDPTAIDASEEELATSAGEDAFFHRADALGIADGVGGWAGVKDADPALFARRLMHHVSIEMQRYEDIDDEMFAHYHEAAPVDVLRRAYEITLDEMEALAVRGSSTACVVVLRGDELRVANLGDCGLTVVRQGDMVYRTEEQQHSFNYPYQLSTEAHTDGASDAQVFRLKIQKGDIIIVGSDGVFDNLFDEDILEEVSHHLPPVMRADGAPELKYSSDSLWYESQGSSNSSSNLAEPGDGTPAAVVAAPGFSLPQFHVDPKAISLAIAKRAKVVSEDARYTESPFQMRAMQEGLYYQGGKRDDITVVVA